MAWPAIDADVFVVCLLKRMESEELLLDALSPSLGFVELLADTMRQCRGKIQLLSHRPESWEVYEGKDHLVEPNHLNPAVFDFNCIVLAAFEDEEAVHSWWNSDLAFEVMKQRKTIETMGVYIIDGVSRGWDIDDYTKMAFGDRFVMFEFLKMVNFKPVQQYVDNYRRYAEATKCHSLFSDGVKNMLINEFPLDAVCGTSWRQKLDAKLWHHSDTFQNQMVPQREGCALCLALLVPMHEATVDDYEKARKHLALRDHMANIGGALGQAMTETTDDV